MSNYRDVVNQTVNPELNTKQKLLNGIMGLAGEAGEVIDLFKKFEFHGKPFDKEKLVKELGDVRWYLELISIAIDVPMSEIEEKNVQKLSIRYPNGFNVQDSAKRVDENGQKERS